VQTPKLDLPLWLAADRVEQKPTFQNFSEVSAKEPVGRIIALDNDPPHFGLLAHEIFRIARELQEGRTQLAMRYEQFA
jgi:hypothetical protein